MRWREVIGIYFIGMCMVVGLAGAGGTVFSMFNYYMTRDLHIEDKSRQGHLLAEIRRLEKKQVEIEWMVLKEEKKLFEVKKEFSELEIKKKILFSLVQIEEHRLKQLKEKK